MERDGHNSQLDSWRIPLLGCLAFSRWMENYERTDLRLHYCGQ